MPERTADVGAVFRALADPTRREVVERLGSGPAATSELAMPYDMALPSFLQHLEVLEEAGIVSSEKTGRVRTYRLVPERLSLVDQWMEIQRRVWQARLDQFDAYVQELEDEE
ncbi:MAG: ArsR/SmtB family transcription factor [Actinomycetota bacterium]